MGFSYSCYHPRICRYRICMHIDIAKRFIDRELIFLGAGPWSGFSIFARFGGWYMDICFFPLDTLSMLYRLGALGF
jgi:hypothetical protein